MAQGATEEQARQRRATIDAAGERALAYKKAGYHCSESVFLAVNETFQIADPAMVRAATGFHGGGGTHRLKPGIRLTPLLAGVAAGSSEIDPDDPDVEQVKHLCGALAAGILCVGLLYGRRSPEDDLDCVDELSFELHRRFREELGHNECASLREIWVPRSDDESCSPIYRQGARIIAEVLLDAHELVPECPALGCGEI